MKHIILLPVFIVITALFVSAGSLVSSTPEPQLRSSVQMKGSNPPPQAEQVLTTVVEDPRNPKEPWTVVSYRTTDESMEAFIKRHKDTVDGVRNILR